MKSSFDAQEVNLPVTSGASLSGSGLGGGDRGQTSGQGEESETLDRGRHSERFLYWNEKNVLYVSFLGKKGESSRNKKYPYGVYIRFTP